MTAPQTAAVGAAVLICGVAAFQLALALGLPLGAATLGGRAPTTEGVLSPAFRAVAALSAAVLVLVVGMVLARAGVIGAGPLGKPFLVWATWGLMGFLTLNTLANLAAPPRRALGHGIDHPHRRRPGRHRRLPRPIARKPAETPDDPSPPRKKWSSHARTPSNSARSGRGRR